MQAHSWPATSIDRLAQGYQRKFDKQSAPTNSFKRIFPVALDSATDEYNAVLRKSATSIKVMTEKGKGRVFSKDDLITVGGWLPVCFAHVASAAGRTL